MKDCYLTPSEQFFSYIMAITRYISIEDDARFVLD